MTLLKKIKHNLIFIGKNGKNKQDKAVALSSALVFLAGVLCAFCLCTVVENCIKYKTAELKVIEADGVINIKPRNKVSINRDYSLLVSEDPFGTKNTDGDIVSPEVESIKLTGTLSSFGAYLDNGTENVLVLKGQEFMGFTLVSIKAAEAVVSKNNIESTITMQFTSSGVSSSSYTNSKPSGIWKKTKPATASLPGVQAASPGSTGTVPRELIDKLLLNPYEEMAKIRMIPSESGMKIARIANDSVLAAVGVQKEDVIKAVNGVNITNLGDATNAINSMMTGTRFDVTVERGGAPVELNYEVR